MTNGNVLTETDGAAGILLVGGLDAGTWPWALELFSPSLFLYEDLKNNR